MNIGPVLANISQGLTRVDKNKIYSLSVDALRSLTLLFPDSLESVIPCYEHIWKLLLCAKAPEPKYPGDESGCGSTIELFFELFLMNSAFWNSLIKKFAGNDENQAKEQILAFLRIVTQKMDTRSVILTESMKSIAMGAALLLPIAENDLQLTSDLFNSVASFCLQIEKRSDPACHQRRKWTEFIQFLHNSPAYRAKAEVYGLRISKHGDIRTLMTQQMKTLCEKNGPQWQAQLGPYLSPDTISFFQFPKMTDRISSREFLLKKILMTSKKIQKEKRKIFFYE